MNKYLFIALICLTASPGCKEIYAPPVVANPPNYLVVEGFINTSDATVFHLSHTVKLDSNAYIPELGARVTIEGTDNSTFFLSEAGNGTYSTTLYGLNNSVSYRLHIITTSGKQYASDYVPLVYDPPIDSISWVRKDNNVTQGIQVYANTHDPQNNTHYYRWEYVETWEFHSAFFATVQYIPGQGLVNYRPNTTYTCWKTRASTNILLGKSDQLTRDVIYEAPLVLIPLGSQQITIRYSIFVKQYALTKDAFDWWQILQKNTEGIGSIFGVQPSANQGNIHCLTDSSEIVLGYVSGGNTWSQRIFITNDQVQPWVYLPDCTGFKIPPDSTAFYYDAGYLPWAQDFYPPAVHVAFKTCVDCTLTGSNIQPSFW